MGGEREKMKNDTSTRSIPGGGKEDFYVTVQEEGGVVEVREGERLAGSAANDDSCSDDGGANDDAGVGKKKSIMYCV